MLRETRVCHVWTDSMIETLKTMWKNGNSKKEIAATLGNGITENAVGGKANRLNLGLHPNVKDNTRSFHQVAHVPRAVAKTTSTGTSAGHTGRPSMPALPISSFRD